MEFRIETKKKTTKKKQKQIKWKANKYAYFACELVHTKIYWLQGDRIY